MSDPRETLSWARPFVRGTVSTTAAALKRVFVDVAIVGYPKCGNTWFSALVRHLLVAHYGLAPERMRRLFVSDLGLLPMPLLRVPRRVPRLYHSHCLPYPREKGLRGMRDCLAPFRNTPMIVLIRDCKDALTSYYMHEVYRARKPRFAGSVAEFMRSPVYGVEKFVAYYNLLAKFRRGSNAPTFVTRYETMWSEPETTLRENAEFVGIENVPAKRLSWAVAQCSIENMRRMERAATQATAMVPSLFRAKSAAPEAYKARKGGIGNWRGHISNEVAAEIDRYVAKHMDPFFHQRAKVSNRTRTD